MPPSDTTISIRLPKETRKALDEAAKVTRRSRAFLVKEALDHHLKRIMSQHNVEDRRRRFQLLYELQGAGAQDGGRSAEDIDAMIRYIRGDD
jgi:predicted DNA-binding protein